MELVRDGIDAYKALRSGIASSVPIFPLGLPAWRDDWIAQGARLGEATLAIAVHRRGGGVEQDIVLPAWLGRTPTATVAYPAWGVADVVPGPAESAILKVSLAEANSARLILVRA